MITHYADLCEHDQQTMKELMRRLGLVPEDVAVRFAVEYIDHRCYLLLTEFVRDGQGRIRLDGDLPAARPHVFEVGRAMLPGPLRPRESS